MGKAASLLADKCFKRGYIEEDQISWLAYCLEKKMVSVFVGIPFLLFGILLTSPSTAIAFFLCFYLLRTRVNGYHSKTAMRCLITSLLFELLFLGLLFRVVGSVVLLCLSYIAAILIFAFAPFEHINMHYTSEEIAACRISARVRTGIICVLITVFYFAELSNIFRGTALGLIMTAVLLCLAYLQRRTCHD